MGGGLRPGAASFGGSRHGSAHGSFKSKQEEEDDDFDAFCDNITAVENKGKKEAQAPA